jgi:hypothetical protein
VKVEVRKKFAFGASGDGVGIGAATSPENSVAIVGEVKVVVAPVDERVGGCKPGFSENEVVVGEGVNECIKRVGVVVAVD